MKAGLGKSMPLLAGVPMCLEFVLIRPSYDDIVDLQHHPAQLCGQQELLAFADQRVYHEMLAHICNVC